MASDKGQARVTTGLVAVVVGSAATGAPMLMDALMAADCHSNAQPGNEKITRGCMRKRVVNVNPRLQLQLRWRLRLRLQSWIAAFRTRAIGGQAGSAVTALRQLPILQSLLELHAPHLPLLQLP